MGAARAMLPHPDYAQIVAHTSPQDLALGVGVAGALATPALVQLAQQTSLYQIVQKSGYLFDSELAAAQRIAKDPRSFLNSPLDTICGPGSEVDSRRFWLNCPADGRKDHALDGFVQFLEGGSNTRRISDRAILCADELFTNAAKNAWPEGSKLFKGPANRKGNLEFFAHADAQRFVVGCKDSFGELKIEKVLSRMVTCFQNGLVDSIRRGPDGAGIGSFLVLESSVSYYAGVERGKCSVACAVLAVGAGMRTAQELPKHIHLFEIA